MATERGKKVRWFGKTIFLLLWLPGRGKNWNSGFRSLLVRWVKEMRMPSSSSFVSSLWLAVAAANLFPCCGHPHPGEFRSGFCCSSCKQTDSVCWCATFDESWGLGFANFRNEKVERFTVWRNSQPEKVPPYFLDIFVCRPNGKSSFCSSRMLAHTHTHTHTHRYTTKKSP